jgi:hypothetical protein
MSSVEDVKNGTEFSVHENGKEQKHNTDDARFTTATAVLIDAINPQSFALLHRYQLLRFALSQLTFEALHRGVVVNLLESVPLGRR